MTNRTAPPGRPRGDIRVDSSIEARLGVPREASRYPVMRGDPPK